MRSRRLMSIGISRYKSPAVSVPFKPHMGNINNFHTQIFMYDHLQD